MVWNIVAKMRHEGVGQAVGDGFVLDVFFPLGEGALLAGGEEEFEPAFGGEVLEGDGVEGAVGWYRWKCAG